MADYYHEQCGLPTTNRDQSCAFCGGSRPRFAHRLDPRRVQFRVYGKGRTLPTFWAVCDDCENLASRRNDDELLRRMLYAEDDALQQQASLAAFHAADLGAARLRDA